MSDFVRDTEKIPKDTPYCYQYVGEYDEKEHCPYYVYEKRTPESCPRVFCKYENRTDFDLYDAVKICGKGFREADYNEKIRENSSM